jgi:hypothetical protein
VETGIEIQFENIQDFIEFSDFSKQVCITNRPKINELFEYVKNIGSGSQAQIDIYRSLLTEDK